MKQYTVTIPSELTPKLEKYAALKDLAPEQLIKQIITFGFVALKLEEQGKPIYVQHGDQLVELEI